MTSLTKLRLLAADSFRVRRNPVTTQVEARGFHRHLQRFRTTALVSIEAYESPDPLDEFLSDSAADIAAYGEGWPRLELWAPEGGGAQQAELRLTLRPLPELSNTIELRSAPADDPLLMQIERAEHKGPNLATYAALNRELGAEALLTNLHGHVLEGATTSLLWWQQDRLHRIAEGNRVASVTESLLTDDIAAHVTASSQTTARALAACEVWAVNALHGIRLVTHIDQVETPAPDLERLQWFRDRLDQTWQPIVA